MPELTLKAARVNLGLSQKEAASRIGVSVETLGNYERGKSFPDIPILRAIEREYGVPYQSLIFLPLDYPLRVKALEEI
jgi:Predicted transcriptional regulators